MCSPATGRAKSGRFEAQDTDSTPGRPATRSDRVVEGLRLRFSIASLSGVCDEHREASRVETRVDLVRPLNAPEEERRGHEQEK